MFLRQLFDKGSSTYSYLIADEGAKQAALIDPVDSQVERDLGLLRELGFELVYVLETHVHADHVTGASELKQRTSARSCASAAGAPCVDVKLRHGDTLPLGALTIEVLGTPGHTDDSLSFLVDGHVFTGDALLVRGNGRTDLQNGDAAQLYDSITRVLFALPNATVVLPGHDYKGLPSSTVGEEKVHNPRLAGKSREQFVTIMQSLLLTPPKRLDVAVPANRACGRTSEL
jgi:sulfur dioxygenase